MEGKSYDRKETKTQLLNHYCTCSYKIYVCVGILFDLNPLKRAYIRKKFELRF